MKRFILSLALCLALSPIATVQAHKVNMDLSSKDGMVYVDCYYPDGRKVEPGCKVEVFDSADRKLLEGETDAQGVFAFTPPGMDDFKIVLDAKLGHKTSNYIFKEELESGKTVKQGAAVSAGHDHGHEHDRDHGHDHDAHDNHDHGHEHGEEAPRPGRVKKEPLPVSGILGGLGFIFGLSALIMQLSGKKKG